MATKKKKPKGKSLSESLAEKDARRDSEPAPAADEDSADGADDDERPEELRSEPPPSRRGASKPEELRSEPPPAFGDDDEDDDDDDDDAPVPAAGDDDGDDGDDEEYDEEYDEDDDAAAQMGHTRYVIAGFFGLWLVLGYVSGKALELLWSTLAAKDWFATNLATLAAIPPEEGLFSRASISLVIGGALAGVGVLRYYYDAATRTWADEVAEELAQVKWPNRKEVGNNTVVVIVASTIITLYLTLLDRFWGFVTNMIYSSGV
jgi:preprotein translocase SecE subunit